MDPQENGAPGEIDSDRLWAIFTPSGLRGYAAPSPTASQLVEQEFSSLPGTLLNE
jgi:hypothetical protein